MNHDKKLNYNITTEVAKYWYYKVVSVTSTSTYLSSLQLQIEITKPMSV